MVRRLGSAASTRLDRALPAGQFGKPGAVGSGDTGRVAPASVTRIEPDGLLAIELVREIPDAMKPRKVEITSGAGRTIETIGTSEQSLEPEREREAA